MYALVDCNNFFVSCERVFDPSLCNRPVVVLSNNDGCVISRSNEAKELGIKMAVPFYQICDQFKKQGGLVRSTNFSLYGDMSDRVMTVLSGLAPEIEIYSVDEAFLHLHEVDDLSHQGHQIVHTVTKHTGIPVSLGIAPTKTLAKIANHFAKKYRGYQNVCLIDTEEKRIKALQKTEIGDVWGIGRRHKNMLLYHGVKTAYDLTLKSRSWIRNKMTVIGERTWTELRGIPCVERDDLSVEKQQICTSRSFGEPIKEYDTLLASVATLTSICATKLRKQHSSAKAICVFVQTNRFKDDPYKPSQTISLSFYSSDTAEITGYCHRALDAIYKPGLEYKRAGVILMDLIRSDYILQDLFDKIDRDKQQRLNQTLDEIIRRNGRESIRLAVQGEGYRKNIRQDHLSRRYTTNLNEIIDVKA